MNNQKYDWNKQELESQKKAEEFGKRLARVAIRRFKKALKKK